MTPGTAREVLVAELLGDAHRVLDRIDDTMPRLEQAAARLEEAVGNFPAATEKTLKLVSARLGADCQQTVEHTNAITTQHAKKVFLAQVEEFRAAAKAVVEKELAPPLRQLTAQLHAAIRESRDPWSQWLTHAATALATLCASLAFFAWTSTSAAEKERPTAAAPVCAQPAAAIEPAAASATPASKARVRH